MHDCMASCSACSSPRHESLVLGQLVWARCVNVPLSSHQCRSGHYLCCDTGQPASAQFAVWQHLALLCCCPCLRYRDRAALGCTLPALQVPPEQTQTPLHLNSCLSSFAPAQQCRISNLQIFSFRMCTLTQGLWQFLCPPVQVSVKR